MSEEIKNILKSLDCTYNIRDDYSDNTYDYSIGINTDETLRLGLTNYDIQKELNMALMGREAGKLKIQSRPGEYSGSMQIPVKVVSDVENADDLKNNIIPVIYAIIESKVKRKPE